MPTYEYTCKSCGEHLEVVQSFKDAMLTTCPSCGGPLRKVFGNIGVVFKGSGFYKTDSRSDAAARKGGEGGKEAGAGGKDTTKDASTSPKPEKAASGSGAAAS